MALSQPKPHFVHRRTVRLIVDDDMEIDALEIAKSLPDFAEDIQGIVPQFGGKCFDITLNSPEAAVKLATAGYDHGELRKPLRLLGIKTVHVSVFVSAQPTRTVWTAQNLQTPPPLFPRGRLSIH